MKISCYYQFPFTDWTVFHVFDNFYNCLITQYPDVIFEKKNSLTSNYTFDEHNGNDDYFLMLYSEILRFGKFNFNTHSNNRIFLEKFLSEKNIDKNHEIYYKYF